MANIQQQIKEAKEAAAAMAAQQETTPPASTAVVEGHVGAGGQVRTFTKPSMATVQAAKSVIPKMTPFLKVNEFGIRIGKNKEFLDSIKVSINMTEDEGFQVKHTLRFGNPAQYLSTYDGVVCDKGGSWGDALHKANLASPGVEPYLSVDVVMKLRADIKLKEETIKAGTLLAFNSSKTNFSEWSDFYAEVAKLEALDQELDVDLGFREIQHNGNTWGVVTFSLANV